jgi:hypothetical protein
MTPDMGEIFTILRKNLFPYELFLTEWVDLFDGD